MPVRVSIFDDNKKLLDSLSILIDGSAGFELAGAYNNCLNIENKISDSQPDVILMDIEMPEINGIEALRKLQLFSKGIKVLMQTAFEDEDKIFDAICAGASGYILKDTQPARMLECIMEVYQGGSPMSPTVARKVLRLLQNQNLPETTVESFDYHLSTREKEILSLLVKGMSYKMIADACKISYETVRSHMKNIYEKLHVASMTEAVAKAINQKLV
jgi:DNA-binding NarL/FixJ family response regulator